MPSCANCGLTRRLHSRGLCRGCYNTPAIRYKHADKRGNLAPPPKPAAPCSVAGCTRRARFRGLCPTCAQDPRNRAAAPDARKRPLSADFERRNAILADPGMCPQSYLRAWARRTLALFRGEARVDLDDLIQAGWTVLIRAADVWEPGGKAATLVSFAGDIVRKEMFREARRFLQSSTAGDTSEVDSGRLFRVCHMRREQEDTNLFHSLLKILPHALQRYRERFRPGATTADLRRDVAKSRPAPEWMLEHLRWGGTAEVETIRSEGDVFTLLGDAVFVLFNGYDHRPTLKTVLELDRLMYRCPGWELAK